MSFLYRYDDSANRGGEHPDDQWSVQIIEEIHGSQESHQRVKSTCKRLSFVRDLTCGFSTKWCKQKYLLKRNYSLREDWFA